MIDAGEFLSTVHKHLAAMLEDGELGLAGYAWLLEDEPDGKDGVTVMALDLDPAQAWQLAMMKMLTPETRFMLFCLDRYGKEGQGTTLGDLVAGIFYEREHTWRPFIVEYARPPEPPRVLWFNWHNKLWNAAVTKELAHATTALCQIVKDEHKRRGMVD